MHPRRPHHATPRHASSRIDANNALMVRGHKNGPHDYDTFRRRAAYPRQPPLALLAAAFTCTSRLWSNCGTTAELLALGLQRAARRVLCGIVTSRAEVYRWRTGAMVSPGAFAESPSLSCTVCSAGPREGGGGGGSGRGRGGGGRGGGGERKG